MSINNNINLDFGAYGDLNANVDANVNTDSDAFYLHGVNIYELSMAVAQEQARTSKNGAYARVQQLKDKNAVVAEGQSLTLLVKKALANAEKDTSSNPGGWLDTKAIDYMRKHNITIGGKSVDAAIADLRTGTGGIFIPKDMLIEMEGQMNNYTQSVNGDVNIEIQSLNMQINTMNAALQQLTTVAEKLSKALDSANVR